MNLIYIYRTFCKDNPNASIKTIQLLFDKLKYHAFSNKEKKELLNMYVKIIMDDLYDSPISNYPKNFQKGFETFMQETFKGLPKNYSSDIDLEELIARGFKRNFDVIALIDYLDSSEERENPTNKKRRQLLIGLCLDITNTISRNQALEMTDASQTSTLE